MKLVFKIEGTKPDRMPGADLAAYMTSLALFLGPREYIHFTAIHSESTGIEAHIGVRARHIVRDRMRSISSAEPPPDLRRYRDEINGLLAKRKTSAKIQEIRRDGTRVNRVEFAGAEKIIPELPGIRENVQVQGILVRIEGRDKTVHAGIDDAGSRYSALISRDQAKEIARSSMFAPVRVEGKALMTRGPSGMWDIGEIDATTIEPLGDGSLADVFEDLRAAGGFGWGDEPQPFEALHELRSGK